MNILYNKHNSVCHYERGVEFDMYEPVMAKYQNDMLRDLKELVAIESVAVRDTAAGDFPFGGKSAEAIAFMLSLGQKMGLATENCDNYACHAQLGEGKADDYAAVLCHVDVVPVGDGWGTDPLVLTEKDGYLYGRGVADDKGAAIVALYCLKAMKANGVPMKRPVRCIFGGGEEIGMDDMEHYFSKHPLPAFAFTPDADYPACHCEKGILHLQFTGPTDAAFLSVQGGSAINCVADRCTAGMNCDAATANAIAARINAGGAECTVSPAENGYAVSVTGVSAHAMCPEKGVNAINCLLTAAEKASVLTQGSAEWFFAGRLCGDTNGKGLGIDCADETSGELTLNVGTIAAADGLSTLRVDIRYPATLDSTPLIQKITEQAGTYGVSVEVIHDNPPLYIPKDHPLLRTLGECYTEITGQPMVPMAMGGGTYARALHGRGVAFGPVFPDAPPSNLHMPNENLPVDDLMRHAEICYRAMCRLAQLEV